MLIWLILCSVWLPRKCGKGKRKMKIRSDKRFIVWFISDLFLGEEKDLFRRGFEHDPGKCDNKFD